MKQNPKSQFQKNLLIIGAAGVCLLSIFSRCKTATAADLNTASRSAATTLNCLMLYTDKKIGSAPAYSKAFTADVGGATSEATTNLFGVSPSDGTYYASVAPNLNSSPSSDVVLMIGNGSTQVKVLSLGSSSAPLLHLAWDLAADREFSLTCHKAAPH